MFRQHPLLSVVTLAYLALVGWLTLGPQPLEEERADNLLWRLIGLFARYDSTSWIDYDRVEFGANVAMFVPVGMFFVLLLGRRRWWFAVLLGVALTIAIESVQLLLPDRVSDPRDLVANSVGALVGVVAVLVLTWPKARRRARAARPRVREFAPR